MRRTATAATLLFLAGFAADAIAQSGFGYFRNRCRWYSDLERVIESGGTGGGEDPNDPFNRARFFRRVTGSGEKKFILVYVRPMNEAKEPNAFSDSTVVKLSYESWAFVKMDLDRDNARQKAWSVRRAPAIIGLDIHGNDFLKYSGVSLSSIRSLTKGLPTAIARYEEKLKRDFKRAKDYLRTDEGRALGALRDIVAGGKTGYKEVTESRALIEEHSEEAFRKVELAESVSVDTGITYLEGLAKMYKETPQGVKAEIRIAELEHQRGNREEAESRLRKILKYTAPTLREEVDRARSVLQKILGAR